MKKSVDDMKNNRKALKEKHKELLKKIDLLGDKNESKAKIITSLVECFEKGLSIANKVDPNQSKSFSREEGSSITGIESPSSKTSKK